MEERWKGRIKLKRIAIIVVIVILIILALFSWFTIYGTQVGNFVITLERSEVNLSLSEDASLKDRSSRIVYPGTNELSDITYQDIPNDISSGDGNKSITKQYLCYSFFVNNESNRSVDYAFDFALVDDDGWMMSMLRVMIIVGNVGKEEGVVFALPEDSEDKKTMLVKELNKYTPYVTREMDLTDEIIFSMTGKDLKINQSEKFTIVMWIEGCDPDCTGLRLDAKLKAEIRITAV